MPSSQQRTGVTIAVVSAIVLLFATVALPWFDAQGLTVDVPGVGEQDLGLGPLVFSGVEVPAGSLWETTSFLDILVAICALGTIVLGALALRGPELTERRATIVAVLGIVALVLVVYVAILPPNNVELSASDLGLPGDGTAAEAEVTADVELGRELGLFIGVLAALGMTIGGGMAARREPASDAGVAPSRRPGE
ncbi:hypothetical protein HJD18_07225 [Thermoleophilia bacterium SCSIO 60948]|nr:hypothetical protein HJD18_07225 [Thermoleophilia bacterium SCSIO 60948]